MTSSSRRAARHPTARGVARAALACALGCASPAIPAAPPAPAAAPADGALVVELVFGAEADLDLYVSDPALETVYFAHTPTRSGGALREDRRCDAAAPRVEQVHWDSPPPGRYRVGVDFPERCADGITEAAYLIRVRRPAGPLTLEGVARFGVFDSRALEFEIPR